MLWATFTVLMAIWALGVAVDVHLGGWIHVLLVLAAITLAARLGRVVWGARRHR